MTKFWVNVENAKHPHHTQTFTAVYGTLEDAKNYAYDYLTTSFGWCKVTICDVNWNTVYSEIW